MYMYWNMYSCTCTCTCRYPVLHSAESAVHIRIHTHAHVHSDLVTVYTLHNKTTHSTAYPGWAMSPSSTSLSLTTPTNVAFKGTSSAGSELERSVVYANSTVPLRTRLPHSVIHLRTRQGDGEGRQTEWTVLSDSSFVLSSIFNWRWHLQSFLFFLKWELSAIIANESGLKVAILNYATLYNKVRSSLAFILVRAHTER